MLRLRPFAAFICLALLLCLIGLWNARSQSGGLRRVTNTTEEGFNTNPSLSGDGRRIAFESSKDLAGTGGSNFPRAFRADVGSDTITFLQMAAARAPAPGISQDGSIIAFAAKENPLGTNADGNSEIFLFDGPTLRQITNTTPASSSERTRHGNFLPSLSDNGRFIAFSSNRNLAGQNGDGNFEIFVFDTASNSFTQLTNTSGTVGATDAKISGDASRVAYIRDNGTLPAVQRDLILQDRIVGATQVLASGVMNLALTYGRAISDDGSRVIYSGETATNASQVFLFDGRRNAVRQLTSLGARDDDVPLHPSISGDGTRVSFATRRPVTAVGGNSDNSIELYTFDIPTGQFARVTNATASNADCFDGSNRSCEVVSSLNDDGSIVAFNFPRSLSGTVTTGTENNTEIYITGTAPRPTVGSLNIVNGASFGNEPATTEAVAPDSIAVAFGGVLSFETVEASRQPDGTFPRSLGGTTVRVNGRLAQIFFVSPTRIHFHVPAETELGTAEVVVTNEEGFRSVGTITVRRAAPGIFTFNDAGQFTLFDDGRGPGAILNADTFTRGPFDPSSGNLRLVIFATGVRKAPQEVTATAGGRALTVESVLPSPDLPGLDEVRVLVPADLRGIGQVDLVIRADDRDSNPVSVTFEGPIRNIVINEVLADPPDGIQGDANHDGTRNGSDDEFVELVNTTTTDLNISGYQLFTRSTTSNDSLRHTFPSGTIMPAGSAIVVFGGGAPVQGNPAFGGAQVFTASQGSLNLINTGGVVTLKEPSQAVMSIFSYGGSTGLNGDANQSLTRAEDITGNFVLHTQAPGGNGNPFSPGTKIDGTPFASGLGRLAKITISPPSVSISVGQTTQFTAQAFDQFNRPFRTATITFESDNTAVATVDSVSTDTTTGISTATVTGRSVGTAHITAQASDGSTIVTSSPATLTVNPVPAVVTRVEVSPTNPTINRGQTQQFTATAFDQNNQQIAAATFSWSSSNTNVATIDANGLATGVGIGSTTITATTADATGAIVSGTATLVVQVPLVINEILADPPDGIAGDANRDNTRDADDDEFVELVNNSAAPVDISGVIVADSTANRFTFPANTTLAAGRAVVIFGGGTPPVNDPAFGGALVFTTTSLSLGNTADTVNVKLPVGGTDVLIATQTYGAEGNDNQSLTRSPDLTGAFVKHTTATNADGRVFSPGTRVDGTPFGSPLITRIEVTPSSDAKDVGGTQVFTARAFSNTSGTEVEVPNVSFIWDSSNTAVATVQPATGQSTTATAVAPGTATIRARAGGQFGTAIFTVNQTPPVLTSVTISPTSATINAGQTQQFTGQALDQFGQPIGGVTITFASNNTTVATVDSVSATSSTGSATATVTGHTNGTAQITATATSGATTVNSAPATLTVAPVANPGDIVISEFRTRGPNGANDEFIELYNRTTAPIDISGYKIFRSNNAGATTLTATISNGVILGSGCHYLLTNSNSSGPYSGSVAGDQTYSTGITADGGIALTIPSGTATTGIIDQVGLSAGSAYKEGTPLAPFAGDAEQSYERKPGGAQGNGTDTNDNAADFFLNTGTSNPQNLSSGCLNLTSADLSITKTDAPDPVITGSDVTYTITVANTGAGTAQSVVVTDNLPGNVTFVSCASTGGGLCGGTGNNRTVTFSQLAGGASAIITIVATANGAAGTTITNTATVSSTTPDPNTANNSATATTAIQQPLPLLSINDVVITEGNSGTKTATFTVTLSASSTQTVTVDYATADGTATAGTDYQSTSGTLTFIPGDTSESVNVTINGDILVEADETFLVNLSNATNAVIQDGQGQGTITNDDTANLVISQVYGGGNNSGATYRNDFVEIFNRGTTTVDFSVTPYSVQYASVSSTASGNFGSNKTNLTTGTIAPGQYFLVQEAGGTTNGIALPTPDATGSIAMAATSGKVALVVGTTALPSTFCPGDDGSSPFNPSSPLIADFVGYGDAVGTAGHCYEGAAPAPAPSNTTADFRKAGGCLDTNDNAADFLVATPNPRNTSSPLNDCSAGLKPEITINDPAAVSESTANATFTVTLSTSSTLTVTVDYATANGTATAGADYTSTSGTLTFAPGETTKSINVPIINDTTDEPSETFFVNLSNATNGVILDNQGLGTITDNDAAPTISINDASVTEGDSGTTNATFTVTLSAASGFTVTVNYATADNTATAGNDYQSTSGTLTFNPGQTSQDITVLVNGDTTFEPNETFFVNLTSPTNATFGDNQGQGTITNDDAAPPVPAFSIDNVTVTEGDSGTKTATFTVSVSMNPTTPVTVDYATANDTATAGSDYVSTSGTLTFNPGDLTKTITVTINGDTLVEPDETFFVNLTNASANAIISDAQGVGTITNDDTANLVISQIYVGGGNSSATYTHDFVEIFNRGTTTIDFAATPYSIQFAGTGASFGSTATTSKTNITSGTIAPGQYFLVQESSGGANGIALPTADATGSINLLTAGGKIALVVGTAALPASTCPGDNGVSPFNPSNSTIADFVGYGGTSATPPDCYEGAGPAPTLTNNTVADFRKSGGCIDTNNNAADFETAAPSPRNTSSPLNACAAPVLSINDASVTEGNTGTTTTATFTVSLNTTSTQTITVNYATADGTATAPDDYLSASNTLTFNPGELTKTINITVNGDASVEVDETFVVNLSSPTNATLGDNQGQGTILNDDVPPPPVVASVTVSPSTATINRGQTQQFTASAFDPSSQPVPSATFTWSSSNTAVATIDQNGLATGVGIGTTTITATTSDGMSGTVSGTATLTVQVPLLINEILADPPGAVATDLAGDANRDGTRNDDDDEFVELFNNSNAPVDISGVIIADATSNRFTFPANTTLAAGRAVVIFGGGTPPTSDPAFGGALVLTVANSATASTTLSLANTADTVTVKLPVAATDVVIDTKTYGSEANNNQSITRSPDAEIGTTGGAFVQHTTATNAAGRVFSPGTRVDGTPFGSPAITRIEVLPATASINIGATQGFTATAYSNVGGPEVTVPNVSFIWDSSDPTKATVSPTTGTSTTATGVAAGSTTIRARAGGQEGTAALTVNAPLTLSINDVTQSETNGATTFTFTVQLSANAPANVTFDIATADGTAQDGNPVGEDTDYVAQSVTGATILAGQQTYTFNVTVNGDTNIETDETFFVNVTNVNGATATDNQGLGTIQNDDASALPSISITSAASGTEGNVGTTNSVTFTVTLSAASASTVTVNYTTTGVTATGDVDFTQVTNGTVTFVPNDTSEQIVIPIIGDRANEGNETFTVTLSNPSNATIAPGAGTGTGTIIDDDYVVISQIYGGGGNASATYANDFVELFNRSSAPVDISTWSIQYHPATSTSSTAWQVAQICPTTTPGTCVIPANSYYLIQLGAGTTAGRPALPTPNSTPTNAINMATGAGKVALVNSTTVITTAATGGCPSSFAGIIDFVGYGTTANCFEGSAPTSPSPGNNTTSVLRKSGGCQDTNDNAADFANSSPPTARNTSTAPNICP